jgi:hypothetical protein
MNAVCPHELQEGRQWTTEPVGGTTRRSTPEDETGSADITGVGS